MENAENARLLLRIPSALKDLVTEQARAERRSVNKTIQVAIEHYVVKRCEEAPR